LPEIPAYPRSARKRQDRPVTPEVAGSSPVAPVQPTEARKSGRANIADEERATAQQRMRMPLVLRQVVDKDRDRLGRVTARLEHLEPDLPQLDRLVIGERRELVLGRRAGAQVDPGTRALAQPKVPSEKVGVERQPR